MAEERTLRLQENLNEFRVHQEYRDIEVEASKITRQISDFANDNVIDRESIQEMQDRIVDEEAPPLDTLNELFKEVGIVLPDNTLRRFEDVRVFHETIVSNRRSYLESEISDALKWAFGS